MRKKDDTFPTLNFYEVYSIYILMCKLWSQICAKSFDLFKQKTFLYKSFFMISVHKKIIWKNLLCLYLHNLVEEPLNLIPKERLCFYVRIDICMFNELSLRFHFILGISCFSESFVSLSNWIIPTFSSFQHLICLHFHKI